MKLELIQLGIDGIKLVVGKYYSREVTIVLNGDVQIIIALIRKVIVGYV